MGRSKKPSAPVSMAFLFRKIANETVVVQTARGKTSMTNWEALARMIHNQALDGKPSAERFLAQLRKKFPGKPAPPGKVIRIVQDEDLEL
jgi:hypothetical protein